MINGFDFIRKIEGSVLFEQVCIHWKICNAIGMETKPVWNHEPERSTAHEDFIVFYDKPILLGDLLKVE